MPGTTRIPTTRTSARKLNASRLDGSCFLEVWNIPFLKQQKPLNIGRAPKGKASLPTIDFQGV